MGIEKKRFIKKDLYNNIFKLYENKFICYKLINDKKYDYDNISSNWIRVNDIKIIFFGNNLQITIPKDHIQKFLNWEEFKNVNKRYFLNIHDKILLQLNYNEQNSKMILKLLNYIEDI
jgi:hypothetical protein